MDSAEKSPYACGRNPLFNTLCHKNHHGFKGAIFMDKRKRVLHAFQNKPVDRPPVGFWFHFPPEKAKGKACIDAHLAYYRESGIDFLKVMSDGYFEYPLPNSIKKSLICERMADSKSPSK